MKLVNNSIEYFSKQLDSKAQEKKIVGNLWNVSVSDRQVTVVVMRPFVWQVSRPLRDQFHSFMR